MYGTKIDGSVMAENVVVHLNAIDARVDLPITRAPPDYYLSVTHKH